MNWIIILFLILISTSFSQDKKKEIGIITFISSQMFYSWFNNTENIKENDSIYLLSDNSFVGIVKFKSSKSVASNIINNLTVGDTVFIYSPNPNLFLTEEETKSLSKIFMNNESKNFIQTAESKLFFGHISLQSTGYTNSNKNNFRNRFRFTYKHNRFLIDNSSLGISFNYNFSNTFIRKNKIKESLNFYQLDFAYQLNENTNFVFGRSFNPYTLSLGVIDGFQLIKSDDNQNYGIILGSRPDTKSYWFNFKLMQLGLFFNRIDSVMSKQINNTVGIFEQTTNLKTDRRFIFIEHSNNLIPLSLITISTEIDFFKLIKNKFIQDINVSSIYTNLYIRPIKNLNITLSFDSRKNIYFIEQWKNNLDSLIENNFRSGLRFFSSYTFLNNFLVTLNYGQSKLQNDSKVSRNAGASLNIFSLPIIKSNFSLSYNNYKSVFLNGNNYIVSVTKNLFEHLDITLMYKQFNFSISKQRFSESFFETSVLFKLQKNMSLSLNFQKALKDSNQDFLIFDISTRF